MTDSIPGHMLQHLYIGSFDGEFQQRLTDAS